MPTKDFEELFALLNAHDVRAIIVGGYARAFHGRPRYTKDINVFIEPTPENAARIVAALAEFGFASFDLQPDDFSTPGKIVQLGVEPNRVDLLTSIDGVSFDEAWEGRAAGRYGVEPVFFLGRNEFVRNKRASGRPIDLLDIEDLL